MDLIKQEQNKTITTSFTEKEKDLIKRTIFTPDTTPDEENLFYYHCAQTGLNPLAKQIYFQKRKGRLVFITSIDGFRLIASRTGEHAGTDDAIFDNDKEPNIASVTVWRIVNGQRHAFTASARWSEYCPPQGQDHMWQKMPFTMLGKCAESLALRKAFPNELCSLYSKEEMDQSQDSDDKTQYESDNNKTVELENLNKNYTVVADPVVMPSSVKTYQPPKIEYVYPKTASFGFNKGKSFHDVGHVQVEKDLKYWLDRSKGKGKMPDDVENFMASANAFLNELDSQGDNPPPIGDADLGYF